MSTTFISPDFTNRPYAPDMNQNGGNNGGSNHGPEVNTSGIATSPGPQQYSMQDAVEPVKGGFTDFLRDNKVMVIIFVLVVVIIICVLIWWMTRGKPTPSINQEAPGPPPQRITPRPLPSQQMQGAPPEQSSQIPPQRPPQQVLPQPTLQQPTGGIETADDKELNRFMHLDESSISESDDDNVSVGGSEDDESDHDNISDSWSVESSDE